MLVRQVMTTDVATVTAAASLPDVIDLMVTRDVSGLPVVDDGGRVVGVVTDADIVARQAEGGAVATRRSSFTDVLHGRHNRWWRKAAGMRVSEIMTSPARTVTATTSLRAAASLMLNQGVRRLPVVDDDDGRLVGIISRRDLLRLFHRSDADIADDVRASLADPTRCPEVHGVTLTCVANGVVFLSGWAASADDAAAIVSVLGALPGVIDVRGGIGHREPVASRVSG
jgi:CBS domain-containing protein